MISGLQDPRSYQVNGGTQDYWKMTNDGRLVYDGKASLVDENGRTLLGYKQMGLATDSQVEGGCSPFWESIKTKPQGLTKPGR